MLKLCGENYLKDQTMSETDFDKQGQKTKISRLAIVAFVLGIVNCFVVTFSWLFSEYFPHLASSLITPLLICTLLSPLLALVVGLVAVKRINASNKKLKGYGFAITDIGLAIGTIVVILVSAICVVPSRPEYDLPVVHITYGTKVTLSRQNPKSQSKEIAPRRLVSIDYENRQACIEVYTKEIGWKEFWLKEAEYSPAGTLIDIEPNSVTIRVTWPGFKHGHEAREFIEKHHDKYQIVEFNNTPNKSEEINILNWGG